MLWFTPTLHPNLSQGNLTQRLPGELLSFTPYLDLAHSKQVHFLIRGVIAAYVDIPLYIDI